MSNKGFWKTVGATFESCADRFKNFLAPEQSEVELAALQKAKEISAMQKAEDAVKAFQPADDAQWTKVNTALERYKT